VKYGINMLLWTGDVTPAHAPVLREIKEWGFDIAELAVLENVDVRNYRDVARILDDVGLDRTLNAGASLEHNPIDDRASVRRATVDYFRRIIDICEVLGVRLLNGPFTAPVNALSMRARTDEEWARAVEVFSELAPIAERAGVVMAHECLNRFQTYFLNTIEDSARFARAVSHPAFRLMYDTYHAHMEEQSPADAIRAGDDLIVHIHASENDRGIPGAGQVGWRETFQALHRAHYAGALVIEAFSQATPEVARLTRTWRQSYAHESDVAREGLRFIRSMWEETA
jgi:D-psicose/D-tagatose/L-ribulose 3-epimerase